MKNIDVFYNAISSTGDKVLKVITLPDMPDTLVKELLDGAVRPQMRIFLDNLALLQGYEGAIFELAYESYEAKEGADNDGKG